MAKRIIHNSRDLVAETIQAGIERDDAQRKAASAMLGALKDITPLFQTALLCTTVEIAREAKPFIDKARAAIAAAHAAGIKSE